jgi:hypothetical protein
MLEEHAEDQIMSKTKQEKRLVSKQRYLSVVGHKLSLYSSGSFLATLGIICLAVLILILIVGIREVVQEITLSSLIPLGSFIAMIVILGGGAFLLFGMSKSAFKTASEIEPVIPVTDRNSHLLPAEESLLRGSDQPPTQLQNELLRAAQEGPQTPQEELLRVPDADD